MENDEVLFVNEDIANEATGVEPVETENSKVAMETTNSEETTETVTENATEAFDEHVEMTHVDDAPEGISEASEPTDDGVGTVANVAEENTSETPEIASEELPEDAKSDANEPVEKPAEATESVENADDIDIDYDPVTGHKTKNVGVRSNEMGGSKIINVADLNTQMKDKVNDFFYYKNNKEILWGKVNNVTMLNQKKEILVSVLWNGVTIRVEGSEYFEPSFDFGKGYEDLEDSEKMRRRASRAKYQRGATVPIIITNIYQNGDTIVLIGSRKKAMAKLRDIYFLHKETDNPQDVNVGDVISEAHVIVPLQYHVIVECLGVETRPDAFALGYDRIPDCRAVFKPGDIIKGFRITKLHINPENEEEPVYLAISGRLPVSFETVRDIEKGSSYIGVVQSFNEESKRYYVTLQNSNVPVTVLQSNVAGGEQLYPGDYVDVNVYRVENKFAMAWVKKINR